MKHTLLFLFAVLFVGMIGAQPTAGLVAYWPMNGNFTDAGPNAVNGTNSGATTTANYANVANAAMNFNNPTSTVAQYATHPVNANLSFSGTQNFTISFTGYVNSPFVHNGGFYDNNLNYNGPGIWFWNSPGYLELRFNYKGGSVGSTIGAFPIATWVHVCVVRNNGIISIYLNGVLNNSAAEGTGTPAYAYPARFGTMFFTAMTPPNYNGHHGKMDELRIYNRALTAAEIAGIAAGALPVKMTSFTASKKENNVTLKWQTQYEQNSSHYVIQRSTDGVNFTDAGRVNAAGNSNNPLSYSYNDLLPIALQSQKTVFYRLQSFDVDGKFSYSQILVVNMDMKEMKLLLSPNPARDMLQVQVGDGVKGEASLTITAAGGKQVYARALVLQDGTNSIPVNISLLSKGNYFVHLETGTGSWTQQLLKTE